MMVIVLYLYFLFMTKKLGQTAGKMIFGLAVIRADEQPLQWRDLLFREVIGRFIYKAFFFLHFLYLIVAFSNEKQGLHDIFGNTREIGRAHRLNSSHVAISYAVFCLKKKK